MIILDEEFNLSLRDICDRCYVDADTIVQLVNYGVVEPRGSSGADWRFSSTHYLRLRRAIRMQKDLELNHAGVALALELHDRIQKLQQEVRFLRAHCDTNKL